MLVYMCDNDECENYVDVKDEHAKTWLHVSYIDKDDSREWHYCSWECLMKDAELEAKEENETREMTFNIADRLLKFIDAVKKFEWKDKSEEEKEEKNESDGDCEEP